MGIENNRHPDIETKIAPSEVNKNELNSPMIEDQKKQEHIKNGNKLDDNTRIGKDGKKEDISPKEDNKKAAVRNEKKENQDIQNIGNNMQNKGIEDSKEQIHANNGKALEENTTIPDEKTGFFKNLSNCFSKKNKPQESEKETKSEGKDAGSELGKFEGLDTAPAPVGNGNTVIRGNHFDDYRDIDKKHVPGRRQGYPMSEWPVKENVNPEDIDGVELFPDEVKDPTRFWAMNQTADPARGKENWLKTASQIPEVRKRLNNGEKLEDLINDKELGPCANVYFNPNHPKAIRVTELPNGGYALNQDGRHRVIAARLCGQELPVVKVTGRYNY